MRKPEPGPMVGLCFMLLVLLLCSPQLPAQTPTREYQLKAVFLFNFTQFVNWPAHCFETDQSPLIIGVVGENPFGSYLTQTVSGEKTNGHPIAVQYFTNEQDIKSCHILFINLKEAKGLGKMLETMQRKNILTISDYPDFLKQGGMIKLVTISNKIKVQINIEACKETEMVISSKLLRLAEIYTTGANH